MATLRRERSENRQAHVPAFAPAVQPLDSSADVTAELKAWANHLRNVVESSRDLSPEASGETVHDQMEEETRGAKNAARVAIFRLHSEEGVLRRCATAGSFPSKSRIDYVLGNSHPVAAAAVRREALYLADIEPGTRSERKRPETRSEYAVPSTIGSRVLGVVDVESDEIDGIKPGTRRFLDQAAHEIAYALERCQSLAKLQASEVRFRSMFERGCVSVGLLSPEGTILTVNPAFARLLGSHPAELAGRRLMDFILAEDAGPVDEWLVRIREGSAASSMVECRLLQTSGAVVWALVTISLLGNKPGSESDVLVVAYNIEERKRAEAERARLQERLAQGQKMKALGALAGGVAHDFNNLLGVISGYISMLRTRLPREDPLQQVVATMQVSAGRATELTQQLLNFSRQEAPCLRPMNLLDSLQNVLKIVTQTFDRRISIEHHFAPRVPSVMGDAGQLELALLNLCINARDAMPEGGTLTLEASAVNLSAGDLPIEASDLAGDYVRVVVRDSGKGMDAHVLGQIFEPFFTTKEGRKGVGLGLALVHGTVAQHQGFIGVRSQIGRGSEFTVHLPVARQAALPEAVELHEPAMGGRGTVLVVDDEPFMVDFSCAAVRELGYSALSATDGREAPIICARKSPPVDAVLLDMVMPGPSWETTIKAIRAIQPSPKVIMTSGYNREREAKRGLQLGAAAFIGKPYTIEQLGRVLKESLSSS
ncbi:MAG: PAS domain S-box protein [Acidobacteria bacterium]|nr:PAS domain S-box protein [Acidobacteriota bacterium]